MGGVPPLGFSGLLLAPVWLWVLIGPLAAIGFVMGLLLSLVMVFVLVRRHFDGE